MFARFIVFGKCAMIKAVMFDLDDTIFDHKAARLAALTALQLEDRRFRKVPLSALESRHGRLLQKNNKRVVRGEVSLSASRLDIIRQLAGESGISLTEENVARYMELYDRTYQENRHAVPGAAKLVRRLVGTVTLCIVSNGHSDIQMEKVRLCGVEDLFDHYIFSGDIRFMKPKPEIFHAALGRCGALPKETVIIGDSWNADIVGATNIGIHAVWLSRYGQPCPDPSLAFEIKSLDDTDGIVRYIRSL